MFWKKWISTSPDGEISPSLNQLRAVALSDVGCVRTNNEDATRFIRPATREVQLQKGYLAIVADGMGGHAAGEVASQMATEIVAKTYYQREESPEDSLYFALAKANRLIWQTAGRNTRQKGMGTTCTTVVIRDAQLFVAHVGDSRAYLYKNGQFVRLTTDHTYVQKLVEEGVISPADAETHPERNVLTRAMGTHNKVEIDVEKPAYLFEDGDRLLLCSDGLYDYLTDDEMAEFLNLEMVSEAAQQMIDLARQRGGHDNITVMIVERIEPDESAEIRPTETLDLL
ncbi:Stp1/IreP family PP2C-type Ser/Thr phosphatase [Arundinibacter roseus]|uniref:Stp1/IreP family PP2C-type Ser/Thr phosphatase n=1 Tax=Arundinibacter roseus TaxID=2070510 RepID=A0A4V2XAT5_9BACT|nr:Stp1/IreP family PP2C-type Ser/Thr phosphatase [Arundinibacter roseus]TDB68835.1 Stp1/IreP family PP2C-type Ser/Thr phosphatase [Arundinibacter roseus]